MRHGRGPLSGKRSRAHRWVAACSVVVVLGTALADRVVASRLHHTQSAAQRREQTISGARAAVPGELMWTSVDGRSFTPDAKTLASVHPDADRKLSIANAALAEPYDEATVDIPAPFAGPEYRVMTPASPGRALMRRGRLSGAAVQTRVLQAPFPAREDHRARTVVLTFDDGPGPKTAQLLDVLREKHVPATFFDVGEQTLLFPNLVRREIAEGHRVENHSWTHRVDFGALTLEQVLSEIDKTDARLEKLTGRRTTFFRSPWGAIPANVLQAAQARGKRLMMWTLHPEPNAPANEIIARTLQNLTPGMILLLHDKRDGDDTLQALPGLIDAIRAAGYEIVALP